jgi:hypothetical protein
MEAAKQMRAKQLQRYNDYVAGKEVDFENHQYKDWKATYNPEDYTRTRKPVKVCTPVWLSIWHGVGWPVS